MDTTIGDPTKTMEQRILERRAAIEAKIKQRKAQQSGAASAALAQKEREEAEAERIRQYGRGDEQVRASRRELGRQKADAFRAITSFRVSADDAENARRQAEEVLVASRRQQVADDADSARTVQGSIQMNFDNLLDSHPNRPRELAEELNKQKDSCTRVIEIKDKLGSELRLQLQAKEETYVVALKSQASDIDRLIESMREQTRALLFAFQREYNSVSSAFGQERTELLDTHDEDMKQVVTLRANRENENRKKRDAKVWDDQRILDDKYEEHSEKYARIKMDFLKDIHELEQELARIRAKYMLGDAKLKYNLKVLNDRNKENKKAAHLHRTKTTKLRSILSSVHAKYAETEKKFRQRNNELTEAFRRVTEQYKDLQVKFQHFEKADVEKRQQIWNMHEEECMTRVHKCLQGDRVIFEEVLGVAWATPDLDFWDAEKEAIEERQRMLDEAAKAEAEGKASANGTGGGTIGSNGDGDNTLELSDVARAMLQVCYSQLRFCLDERIRLVIDELGDTEEADQVKVEAVLEALGIERNQEVQNMLNYFVVTPEENEDGSMEEPSAAMIDPQEALRVLFTYLSDRREKEAQAQREANGEGGVDGNNTAGAHGVPPLDLAGTGNPNASVSPSRMSTMMGGTAASKILNQTNAAAAEARREEVKQRLRERNFWSKMSNVISPEHLRVWNSVESGLSKYLEQLQMRQKLIEETDSIRRQNDELRGLLNQYLSSGLNDELFAPPQLQVVGAGGH